jgi:hypothetical protein
MVCGGLDSFLSLVKKNEERKTHNMLSLMLPHDLKTFVWYFHLLVVNKAFYVVKKYNRKSWQPMLLK